MMNALAIIPNENKLEVDPFYHDLEEGERHGKGIKRFCDRHNLGITSESLGLNEGEYPGYRWQQAVASIGHLVICLDEELWAFLPERLSNNQRKWFKEHKHFFTKYKKRLSYVVFNEIGEIIEASEYLHSDSYHNLFNYIKNEETRESELKR